MSVTNNNSKKKKQKVRKRVGESHVVETLGPSTYVNFEIKLHVGNPDKEMVIKPFDGKEAQFYEWFRNISAFEGSDPRTEEATYLETQKDRPIYFTNPQRAEGHYDIAIFASNKDGVKYDVAERLVLKGLKQGDQVILTVLGCCTLVGVERLS